MQEIGPVNVFTFGIEILNFLFELRPDVKWLQPTGDVFDLPMYYKFYFSKKKKKKVFNFMYIHIQK